VKLYKKTKLTDEQEDKFVFPHVMAMTKEGLNSKADIAYELGCRDLEIEGLREKLDAWAEKYADLKIESDANQWAHDNMQEQLAKTKDLVWFTRDEIKGLNKDDQFVIDLTKRDLEQQALAVEKFCLPFTLRGGYGDIVWEQGKKVSQNLREQASEGKG